MEGRDFPEPVPKGSAKQREDAQNQQDHDGEVSGSEARELNHVNEDEFMAQPQPRA